MTDTPAKLNKSTGEGTVELDSPERRDALEKLAALSLWVAPTTLMLLRSKRASAESLPNDPNNY